MVHNWLEGGREGKIKRVKMRKNERKKEYGTVKRTNGVKRRGHERGSIDAK